MVEEKVPASFENMPERPPSFVCFLTSPGFVICAQAAAGIQKLLQAEHEAAEVVAAAKMGDIRRTPGMRLVVPFGPFRGRHVQLGGCVSVF